MTMTKYGTRSRALLKKWVPAVLAMLQFLIIICPVERVIAAGILPGIQAGSVSAPTVILTEEEKAYLEELGTIYMCVDPDWAPFETLTDEGYYLGIAADTIYLVEERLGINIEIIPTKDWNESIELSRQGKCHVLTFLNKTQQREEWLLFTEPVYTDANVIITRQDHTYISDLMDVRNQTMVLPEGTSIEERVRTDYPDIEIIIVGSEIECYQKVVDGQADMTLRSLTVSAYTIRKEGYFNLKIAGQVSEYTNYLRLGIIKSEPMLRDILNKGIATITTEEKDAIFNKYVNIEMRKEVDFADLREVIVIALILIAALSVGLIQSRRTIRQKQKSEQAIQRSEQKYRSLFENAVEGIAVLQDSKIQLANAALGRILGRPTKSLSGLGLETWIHEEDVRWVLEYHRMRAKGMKDREKIRFRIRRKDGEMRWVESEGIQYDWNGKPAALNFFLDITENKAAEDRIRFLSYNDQLTGLYNRRFYEEERERIDNEGMLPISVIIGDVNGLKLTNDVFGHVAGDLLLTKAAEALQRHTRKRDVVARIGGDEYAAILPDTTLDEAMKIAEQVKQSFAEEAIFAIRGSISLGVATKVHADQDILAIIDKAEDAMYSEKSNHRKDIKGGLIKNIVDNLHSENPGEKTHAEQVAEICERIARKMGLSEERTKQARRAGAYHNVGRITTENNRGQEDTLHQADLGREETRPVSSDIENYPAVGFRVLSVFEETADIAEAVLAQRENWDGSGYAKGQKGKEIPVVARIIRVACDYDDQLTHLLGRGYDRIQASRMAISTIDKSSGTLYDPEIIEALRQAEDPN
ncbi:MAG: diguanylate cyclase [Clostridiaceae bacterium]|nr:diguanylate cyclase [Clostridiaceae bacterium]